MPAQMSIRMRNLQGRALLDLGLPALTILFGLQSLRVFIPSVLNYYGVQPGVTTIDVGMLALAVFALGILAPFVHRLLGARLTLVLTAGGLALLRLWLQVGTTPGQTLAAGAAATLLFLWFIPTYLGQARARGSLQATEFGLALLLGLAFDTTLQGAAMTWDLSWQHGPLTLMLIAALVIVQLAFLARDVQMSLAKPHDAAVLSTLILLGLGPWLLLEELVYQNIGQLTVLSGQALPVAFGWIAVANALGVLLAVEFQRIEHNWWQPVIAALLLLGLIAALDKTILAPIWFLAGQVILADLLINIMRAMDRLPVRRGFWRIPLVSALSMFIFALLVFMYYIRYDMRMPFSGTAVLSLAAMVLGLCAVTAGYMIRYQTDSVRITWAPLGVALCLLVVPLAVGVTWRAPQPTAGHGWPVRVMTYNLHYGFDTDGRLALESLAATIEKAQPDIVGLQEVSRGWYIAGSADMLSWLSHRLAMPYVFAPASDAIWGNAILSKYPIVDWGYSFLPSFDQPLRRSYVWATIDLGNGQSVLFTAVHTHHLENGSAIRQAQLAEVVRFWNKRPNAIIVGDMNAEPDAPEIAMMRNAGLIDAWTQAGNGPGLTYISSGPYQRIDYIWLSPDLKARDGFIPQSTASDHRGVAVTAGP